MSLLQSTVGQLACALLGGHQISEQDEQKLYDCPDAEIETHCVRCGAPIHLEIDPENEESYLVTDA